MSAKYSKEFVALLANVVTDICDDSDDEDILPLKAAVESWRTRKRKMPTKNKKSEVTFDDCQYRSSKRLPEKYHKYITLSRFEDKSLVKPPTLLEVGSVCDVTCKIESNCLCSKHRKQPHDFRDFQEIFSTILLDIDFNTFWKMKKATVEVIYNIVLGCKSVFSNTPLTSIGYLAVIYGLTSGDGIENVTTRFSISKEDYVDQERNVISAIMEKRWEFENWPRDRTAMLTMEKFADLTGLAGVLGAVASVHFQMDILSQSRVYCNDSGDDTIVFELVCNHRGSFTYSSYFGIPGSISSPNINSITTLASKPIPPQMYLVGDKSYAFCKNILTPYCDPQDPRSLIFNERHAVAWNILQTSVSKLVSRFSSLQLMPSYLYKVWEIRKKFNCCLLLHNVCLDLEDEIVGDSSLVMSKFFPDITVTNMFTAEHSLREQVCSSLQF